MVARILSLALVIALIGCAPKADNSRVRLPSPVESTTVGAGDALTIEVVGEKDLPVDYEVASDGTVVIPYIDRVQVAGLEPQQIAAAIRKRLIEEKILDDPNVLVRVKAYNSKRITVLGQVQKPGSFPLSPGMTLIHVISLAGGMTPIANGDWVNLSRKTKKGTLTVVLSVDAIIDGRSPDIPLQAGDQVYVHERVF
jgi:polysaccharide export outer membrane protein